MSIKTETKFINPQLAEEILATSGFNRSVSTSRVLTLANEMRAGKWQLNGETLIISDSGKLLDGQHRLYAILESGCTIELMIVRGVPEVSFETIDTGRARTGADILGMNNYSHTLISAAAASMIWRLYHTGNITDVCPPVFQLRVMERYPAIQKWAPFVASGNAIVPRAAFLTALSYLEDIAKKPSTAERFYAGIVKGADLTEGSPLLALRNRMLNMRAEGRIMNNTTCWAAVARTITGIERGELIQRLPAEKSTGAARPALWDEHMIHLEKSKRLDDIGPAAEDWQRSRARLGAKVEEVRSIAKGAA